MKKLLWLMCIGLLVFTECFGDEQLFGYVQSSEVIPKGGKQFYQWMTYREGRGRGNFNAQDYRSEFEYGVTNRLQASLYLNARAFQNVNSAPLEDGSPTYPNRQDKLRFDGVSTAFKYNILSPFKPNKFGNIGLAAYVEPGYSNVFNVTGDNMTSYYVETKLILQKNFFEDKLVTAFNVENAFVKRRLKGSSTWQDDLEMNLTGGASYMIHPNWYLGWEGRYHSEYPRTYENGNFWQNSAKYGFLQQNILFTGPNIHYTTKYWWITLTWLKQVKGWATSDDPAYYNGNLHLVDHERNEVRLKVAYNFL